MSGGGGGGARVGWNLALASGLALLSYVPFEIVAKGSLIFCAVLFIVDPIPPVSRLLSLLSVLVVAVLTRWYRNLKEQQQVQEQLEYEVTISTLQHQARTTPMQHDEISPKTPNLNVKSDGAKKTN